MFKGGWKAGDCFKHMKTWFYNGFSQRKSLSYTKIASASRKLPSNWKILHEKIIKSIETTQMTRREELLVIPGIIDDKFINADNVPMYWDIAWAYLRAKTSIGGGLKRNNRRQVAIGSGDKDRFTIQLSITKSGKKLKLLIIFKAKESNSSW